MTAPPDPDGQTSAATDGRVSQLGCKPLLLFCPPRNTEFRPRLRNLIFPRQSSCGGPTSKRVNKRPGIVRRGRVVMIIIMIISQISISWKKTRCELLPEPWGFDELLNQTAKVLFSLREHRKANTESQYRRTHLKKRRTTMKSNAQDETDYSILIMNYDNSLPALLKLNCNRQTNKYCISNKQEWFAPPPFIWWGLLNDDQHTVFCLI